MDAIDAARASAVISKTNRLVAAVDRLLNEVSWRHGSARDEINAIIRDLRAILPQDAG